MSELTIPSYRQAVGELMHQLADALPDDALQTFTRDAERLSQAYPQPLKIKTGEKAPPFSLPNAVGKTVALTELLEQGPVVITFYRGGWCPYCNLELSQYQHILPQIREAGAHFVAISPQTPDQSLSMAEKNALQFEVLSDTGNLVARQYTGVFTYPDASVEAMAALGLDFDAYYADNARELPVPAVFVVDRTGTVVYAHSAGGDYRYRSEPAAVLEALKGV